MSKIYDIVQKYEDESAEIQKFCEDIYNNMFAEYFTQVRELYARMQSVARPITDEELEYILSTFPLELFTVAENLNRLRLDYEVVRLKNKEMQEDLRKQYQSECKDFEITKAEKSEYVNRQVIHDMTEYEILSAAYSSIITRVENEQSFSRELIMGAKKIWDSRRASERSNPVEPVEPAATELPEYNRQQYIK